MPNAVKMTKKKIFEKDQAKILWKNDNLSRNYLVRPLAPESTKNSFLEFFLTLQDPTIKN